MRRFSQSASPSKFGSRGGAFGLAQDEPTLRKLVRWVLARGAKGVVAFALLLYVVGMCVFFASDLVGPAIGNDAPHFTTTRTATPPAIAAAADAAPTALPVAELAAINKLLGVTDRDTGAIRGADAQLPNTVDPAPAETHPTAAQVALQAGREALPQQTQSSSPPPEASSASPMSSQQVAAKLDELAAAVIAAALAPFSDTDRATWSVEDHAKELKRLEILRDTAQSEVVRLQTILDSAKRLHEAEANEYESILAIRALDHRKALPRRIRSHLTCLGWKQTSGCGPYGAREPASDKACNQLLTGGVSGYCELLDPDTNEHLRVMQLNCSSVRDHVSFSCTGAADFANFGLAGQHVFEQATAAPLASLRGAQGSGNGIVMVVYPKLMTSAYATIRTLRALNCSLPIELWVLESEMARNPKKSAILRVIERTYGPVHVKTITDPTITGFTTKIHAIYHSNFENVLFLDADNVPVKDPTFLFASREFEASSAVFWPDFWHPANTIFNIHELSLLWELVDLEFVDMFEQESGQLLINRRKSAVAMEVLQFYALHRPNHFDRLILAHGDKDLFRLAWLKAKTPFYMIPFPPGAAGTVREATFCGMTMVQYDATGDVLFLHRNAKKLNGRVFQMDNEYWTHLQTFDWNYRDPADGQHVGDVDGNELDNKPQTLSAQQLRARRLTAASLTQSAMPMRYEDVKERYMIGIQSSAPLFSEFQSCYGAEPVAYPYFNLTSWSDLPFAGIEKQIIEYAHEAALLTTKRRRD